MTASTPNQQVVRPSGDLTGQQMAAQPVSPAPSGGQYSGTVSRGDLAPVNGTASQPTQTASIPLAPTYGSNDGMAQQATTASAPAPAGGRVTVQPGDTVYGLARRYGVSASSIMQANGMSPSDNLRSGATVVIPGASGNAVVASAPAANSGSLQPPKPATVAAGSYKVQPGDTLGRIARNTGSTVRAITEANGLTEGAIRVGQTLTIPGGSGSAQVASAAPASGTLVAPRPQPAAAAPAPAAPKAAPAQNTEQVASYTPPKKTENVIEQSDEAAPNATGIGRMRWPVRGRVISQFGSGSGKSSDGIDISVPEGTSVKAAENGVVIYAGDGLKEFGNTVLVRHEDGLVTVYGHASNLTVKRGDQVKRGQEIAVSGMSGQTDAPKLHFEVRKNSAPVNPSTYLE